MIIGAIDIGSNAARLQITRIIEFNELITFKKLEYIRFPLRLGKDVFHSGKIGLDKSNRFHLLMETFKNLMTLYDVEHYKACATSAMREAENAEEVKKSIAQNTGINIEIISGKQEADLIKEVIKLDLDEKTYLHIDVGGGSTELNLFVNNEKMDCASFPIGSVRNLTFTEHTNVWQNIINWITKSIKKEYGKVTAVGTGGNISKIFELAGVESNRSITLRKIIKTREAIHKLTAEERGHRFHLNPDRADVIVPATDIYVEIMNLIKSKVMFVPNVGLKDGINYQIYSEFFPSSGKIFVKN